MQGPFHAPARQATIRPKASVMLVASGIGITPFFSIMATKVTDEQNHEHDRDVFVALFQEELGHRTREFGTGGSSGSLFKVLKSMTPRISGKISTSLSKKAGGMNGSTGSSMDKLDELESRQTRRMSIMDEIEIDEQEAHLKPKDMRVIWSIREVSELMFYFDYVYELVKHQNALRKPVVFVDIYLTGLGKGTDPSYLLSQSLFLLSLTSKTSDYMKIHFGRPDLDGVVSQHEPDEIYYCGGSVLKNALTEICIKNKIHFHPEDFDAGANMLRNVKNAISSRCSVIYKNICGANAKNTNNSAGTGSSKATSPTRTHSITEKPSTPGVKPDAPVYAHEEKKSEDEMSAMRDVELAQNSVELQSAEIAGLLTGDEAMHDISSVSVHK